MNVAGQVIKRYPQILEKKVAGRTLTQSKDPISIRCHRYYSLISSVRTATAERNDKLIANNIGNR